MRGAAAAHVSLMQKSSTYFACGPWTGNVLWLAQSTEDLIAALLSTTHPGYLTFSPTARAVARHAYLTAAASSVQFGLVEAAEAGGDWRLAAAPAWERERLMAPKSGRPPIGGSWTGIVPLVLVEPADVRSRSARITTTGNVLIVRGGGPAQVLIGLKRLGLIDAGRVDAKSRTREHYL